MVQPHHKNNTPPSLETIQFKDIDCKKVYIPSIGQNMVLGEAPVSIDIGASSCIVSTHLLEVMNPNGVYELSESNCSQVTLADG